MQSVGQPHGPVGEAVADVERHGLAVEAAQHHPAALGAEVDGREPQGLSHPGLPMPAAAAPRPRRRAISSRPRRANAARLGTSTLRISSPPDTTWKSFSLNELVSSSALRSRA